MKTNPNQTGEMTDLERIEASYSSGSQTAAVPVPNQTGEMTDEQVVREVYRTAFEWEGEIRIDGGATIGFSWADARAKLAKPSAPPTEPTVESSEMEQLRAALKKVILWCPRGWSIELDQAMTAARALLKPVTEEPK